MTATEGQPPTAAALLLRLKQQVLGIGKEGFNEQGSYKFRGIDQVINRCGPIERELGLLVYPEVISETSDQAEYGGKRTLAFRTRVQVRYHWLAPSGDELVVGPVAGEAIDTGDKGTAKAMSVALRVMYLQTLTIPTDEPDPDSQTYEIAKPEATTSDPMVIAELADRIKKADSRAKLQAAYKSVQAAYEGDQASITKEDADRATEAIKAKLAELESPKAAPAQTREQQMSASTNAAGGVHPNAPTPDEKS